MPLTPPIVDRYLFLECVRAWVAVVTVMMVLTLGLGFARVVSEAAAGGIPMDALLTAVLFSTVEDLQIVLPISALLAILLAMGRLCRDNEMAALAAGGVGFRRLYRPIGLFAILLVLPLAWLSLFAGPAAGRSLQQLQVAAAAIVLGSIQPGRFVVLDDGNTVFYAGAVGGNASLENIFIRLHRQGEEAAVVVTAQRAVYQLDAKSGQQTLVLYDGWRYRGTPGQPDYRITAFGEHGLSIGRAALTTDYSLEHLPTARLLEIANAPAWAEWHARIALPVSLLLLAFLAVPLGLQPPRAGYYPRLVLGILLYVAYANVLRLGEVWLAEGRVPASVGLWWVHALVLALAGILIARYSGYLRATPKASSQA